MQSHFVYHYTAFKYKKLWKPFKKRLSEKLFPLKGEKLLIFGGSSCSCLETSFLKKFKTVIVYDKDPMAPLIFRLFHGLTVKPKYFIEDSFSFDGLSLDARRTLQIIEAHSPDSILFSNVIGQLPLYYKKYFSTQNYIQWSQDLVQGLSGKNWMSFHDIFSFRPKKNYVEGFNIQKEMKILDIYTKDTFPQKIADHLTLEQKWPRPSEAIKWQLTPKSTHYVEITGGEAADSGS